MIGENTVDIPDDKASITNGELKLNYGGEPYSIPVSQQDQSNIPVYNMDALNINVQTTESESLITSGSLNGLNNPDTFSQNEAGEQWTSDPSHPSQGGKPRPGESQWASYPEDRVNESRPEIQSKEKSSSQNETSEEWTSDPSHSTQGGKPTPEESQLASYPKEEQPQTSSTPGDRVNLPSPEKEPSKQRLQSPPASKNQSYLSASLYGALMDEISLFKYFFQSSPYIGANDFVAPKGLSGAELQKFVPPYHKISRIEAHRLHPYERIYVKIDPKSIKDMKNPRNLALGGLSGVLISGVGMILQDSKSKYTKLSGDILEGTGVTIGTLSTIGTIVAMPAAGTLAFVVFTGIGVGLSGYNLGSYGMKLVAKTGLDPANALWYVFSSDAFNERNIRAMKRKRAEYRAMKKTPTSR